MEYLKHLLIAVSVMLSSSVWAQDTPSVAKFINLYYNVDANGADPSADPKFDDGTGTLYLAQAERLCEKKKAVDVQGLTGNTYCVSSEEIKADNAVSQIVTRLLKSYWNNEAGKNYCSPRLKLASDIDFNEKLGLSQGVYKCSDEFPGIEFSGNYFDGNGKRISNICGVPYAGNWKEPMGFFRKLSKDTVVNLKLDSVDFIILRMTSDGSSVPTDEAKYKPVGGLAGWIEKGSVVDNVSLGYINVSAPVAGGLAGYVEKSEITNISMIGNDSKIGATNDIVIKKNEHDSKMDGFKSVLGGLVAISYSSSFKNIEIYPETIQSDANVESSALGGFVGLFVYKEKVEIENVKVKTPDAGKLVSITGGTTMGGLIGKAKKEGPASSALLINDALVENLSMQNSRVYSSSSGRATDNEKYGIYMGGILGNGDFCDGGALKITNSKSKNFGISESIPATGNYTYYVGGIAGNAGCGKSVKAEDNQFLTLTNSRASGSIEIKGGYTSSKGGSYHISGAVGGLVGSALVAASNAVTEDTSLVNISFNAKSTPQSSASASSPQAESKPDSIAIGGILGEANIINASNNVLNLSKITVDGSIAVDDDGIKSYVGGVIGKFPNVSSPEKSGISFKNVSVSGANSLITYGGKGNSSKETDAYIGGVCGQCTSVRNLYRISVVGNISKKASSGESSGSALKNKLFHVGGLIGNAVISDDPIYVENTYSLGDFTDFIEKTSDKGEHTAYLIGFLSGDVEKANGFTANYHAGNDNAVAIGKFGDVERVVIFSNVPDAMIESAVANIHNDASRKLYSDNTGKKKNNGTMVVDEMKADALYNYLQNAWADDKASNRIWYHVAGSYPVFSDGPYSSSSSSSRDGGSSSAMTKSSSSAMTESSSSVVKSSSSIASSSSSSSRDGGSSSAMTKSSSSAMTKSSSSVVKSSSSVASSSSSSSRDGGSSSAMTESSSSVVKSSSSVASSSSSSSRDGGSSSAMTKSSSSVMTKSSSSTAKSSSSVASSSSSSSRDGGSSSAMTKSSSSTAKSSSSSKAKSSSSSKKQVVAFTDLTAKQDGNALRIVFNDSLAKKSESPNYRIIVESESGVYLDTVVDGKLIDKAQKGTWRLDPAPAGDYTVTFKLVGGADSVSYSKSFKTEKKKSVTLAPNSWSTYSLYAFCQNKGESCQNDLHERISRQQKVGTNDKSQDVDYSVYWWDESNAVGDFWQYRKFDTKQSFDSTRGYWYGAASSEPLMLNLQTPDMKTEIVWKLQKRYSGWNLVANPFGWYVKLPQDSTLAFWRWDSESSGYVRADTLGPYEAVWVHTKKSREFRIPLKASIVLEGEKKTLAKSAASENWNLRVELSDDKGKRDAWNELAAGRHESSLAEPPSGMGDRVNLSIVENGKSLAKSVKTNSDDFVWDLQASATSPRMGHLNFVGLESVWAKGLRVYATVDDETVEIENEKSLDVMLSSKAKNVSIRVAKSATPVNIVKSLLKNLHVNQTPNVLNVGFDAAAKLAGEKVKVDIVGIDGRVVATSKSVANEGSNVVEMKTPKHGVYFVHAKVGSQSAIARIMIR